MTEENVQELQDKALGQYTRLKKNLPAARERLETVGKEMSNVGSDLRNKPVQHWIGFKFASFSWLNVSTLEQLASDIQTAENEVQQAKIKAINLGVALSE